MTKQFSTFIIKALPIAVATASMGAYGAGLDRSGQDITAFLQDGTYAEAVYTYVEADVSGHDNGVANGASTDVAYTQGRNTGDIAEAYDFFRFGVKADINDRFSVGVIYDEPFGAAVQHFGNSNFITQGADATISGMTGGRVPSLAAAQAAFAQARAAGDVATATTLGAAINAATVAQAQAGQGTNVEIRTNNASLLLGAKLGANKNFQIYGGPAAQRLDGEVHLRGIAYQGAVGYDAKISRDTELGWVAGVAYLKPEIALKASLTYRSEIEHNSTIYESFPALGVVTNRDFSVTLPESYNLDFQTGINPTTLVTAKVRYVPWGNFDIRPPTYGDATARTNNGTPLPIISYAKDQWSGEVGIAKRLSDKVVVSGNIGYDSGAGNPASSLGPIEGYYSVGLGARYNFTPEWSVALGGKYLMFGDATATLPTGATVGKFKDNDGFIAGLKIAYQGK